MSAVALLGIAGLVLVRAGVAGAPAPAGTAAVVGTWIILGFLVLNTVANLTAPHPVERWIMGPLTAVTAVLVAIVAIRSR